MNYHVYLELGDHCHVWANADYEFMIQGLVIPYINKQVVPVTFSEGTAILNMGTASILRVFKTNEPIQDDVNVIHEKLVSSEFIKNECTQEVIDLALLGKANDDSKSLLQTSFSPIKKQVFVVMKFQDKLLDSAYEGAIKPIIKKYKYKPLRIDEIQDSGKITDQILREIARSEIVLVDLTGEKPNCYYEAGFAHALGKELIFTIRKNTPIHFDLSTYRFIQWETEEELRRELQKRFKTIATKARQDNKVSAWPAPNYCTTSKV